MPDAQGLTVRGMARMQVLLWGADVMRWLHSTAQQSPEQQTLVVEAFTAWVRLGLLYEQDLPQMEVQGLLSLTFQALLHSSDGEPFLHLCGRDQLHYARRHAAWPFTEEDSQQKREDCICVPRVFWPVLDSSALCLNNCGGGNLAISAKNLLRSGMHRGGKETPHVDVRHHPDLSQVIWQLPPLQPLTSQSRPQSRCSHTCCPQCCPCPAWLSRYPPAVDAVMTLARYSPDVHAFWFIWHCVILVS